MSDTLIALPLPVLERLLEAVEAGRVVPPLTEAALMVERLGVLRPHLPFLSRYPERAALHGLLAAIVGLRRGERVRPRPELVWTGPEPQRGRARRTSVIVPELLQGAQREVFLAGYSFMGEGELLAPLHVAMRDRGVRVEIVIDGSGVEVDHDVPPQEVLDRAVTAFWKWTWPWESPRPTLLYDPRTLTRVWKPRWQRWMSEASMHAKCVVVDRRRVLIGSANFTARAQFHNIEVGVVMSDVDLAEALLHQWRAVVSEQLVRSVTG